MQPVDVGKVSGRVCDRYAHGPSCMQAITDGQVFEAVAKFDGESAAAAFTCAAVKGTRIVTANSQIPTLL